MSLDIFAKNGISLERLVTLCSVVESGSIAAAAGSSTTRQSQFSRQIKELEEALGGKLFERVGKTLRPTPLGRQLARTSRVFFGAVNDLAETETQKPGVLNIGGGEGLLRWLFVPSQRALNSLHPPVHCRVRSLRSSAVIEELGLGRIDLGLVRRSAVPDGFAIEAVGTFEFVFVVPRQLLRSRDVGEIYEGRSVPFAELMGDGQLATMAREISALAGIQLNRVLQAETLSLLLSVVEQGDAAAYLPTVAAARLPGDRFAVVRVPRLSRLSRETALTWSSDVADQKPFLGQAIRALSRGLRQTMAEAAQSAAGGGEEQPNAAEERPAPGDPPST